LVDGPHNTALMENSSGNLQSETSLLKYEHFKGVKNIIGRTCFLGKMAVLYG
jgi:hypothetical protein